METQFKAKDNNQKRNLAQQKSAESRKKAASASAFTPPASTSTSLLTQLKAISATKKPPSFFPPDAPKQLKSKNKGLPSEVQAKMENTMGHDFSDVQIHKNSPNASAAGAQAYAQGNDVHFAPGKYNPKSQSGQELIGHELAHVAQQREGRVKPTAMLGKGMPVNDDVSLENEADSLGKKAATSTASGSVASLKRNPSSKIIQGFGIPNWMKKGAKAIGNGAKSIGRGAVNGAKAIGSGAESIGKSALSGAKSFGRGALNVAKSAGAATLDAGKSIYDGGKHIVKGGVRAAGEIGKGTWNATKSVGGGLWNGAKNIGSGAWNATKDVGGGLWNGAKNIGGGLWGGAKNIGAGAWDGMKSVGGGIAKSANQAWNKDFTGAAKSLGGGLWGGAKSLGGGLWDGAKSIGGGLWGGAKDVGGGLWNGAKNLGGGLLGGAKSVGSGLWNGVKDIGSGVKGGVMEALGGLANGAQNLLSAPVDLTLGFMDHLRGPKGTAINQSDIPKEQSFDEFMTDLAYTRLEEGEKLSAEATKRLIAEGYNPATFQTLAGKDGFQAAHILPSRGSKKLPHFSVRGSEANSDFFKDWGSDFDHKQVGDRQFNANKDEIMATIALLQAQSPDGKIDMSGHSLGGGLAQNITAHNPSAVNRLTTFQAPGQSQETLDLYNQNVANIPEADRPEINHHLVDNGLVYKTGEASLPGNFYKHHTGAGNLGSAHTETLVDPKGINGPASQHGVTKYNSFPEPHKRGAIEPLRKGAGAGIRPIFKGIDWIKDQF